ncbi:MAG: hypothetical protein LBF59_04270 [Prevotellaceae bacterium]|nr:hypothetical protein [Prevotellaceae bacterium]
MKSKKIIIIACACLTMQFAYGQQNAGQTKNDPETLKQKAIKLLNGLTEATPVASENNRIGLSIDSVKKSGDDYDIYIKCSNSRVQNSGTVTVVRTYFIDPENYKNLYQPCTIKDNGSITFTFSSTPDGTLIVSVKLKPVSEVMYVYFRGIEESELAEIYTAPLFFTVVLGDKPFVLEQTPRHARTLFDDAVKEFGENFK